MFRNSIKLFKELANEFKQSEDRFQEGKERHQERKQRIRERKKQMETGRSSKRVYSVKRVWTGDFYEVAKGLRDAGKYMEDTGFLDETGQPIYIGDVVSVNNSEYQRDRSGYHTIIVIGERSGKPFAMGYGDASLDELKLIKTRCVNTIAETYKEQDFIIGDESLLESIREVKSMVDAYAEQLGGELDKKLHKVTTDNIEVIANDEDFYDAFEGMKISDIRNLIEKTPDENIKRKAKAFLKELAES